MLNALRWRDRTRRQDGYGTSGDAKSHFCQKAGRLGSAMRKWPQLHWIDIIHLDFKQDWADHRPVSQSSVKPRRTRDCMMNESWFDSPTVITGHVAFARTKWEHTLSLRAAFCCEKIGVQPTCLTLELGDWSDCTQKCLGLPAS